MYQNIKSIIMTIRIPITPNARSKTNPHTTLKATSLTIGILLISNFLVDPPQLGQYS
jgi:hypothetical protein